MLSCLFSLASAGVHHTHCCPSYFPDGLHLQFVVKWEVLKYQTVPLPIIRFCLLPSACLLDQPYIMPPQESQWSRLHPQILIIRFDPDVKSRAPV